MPPTRPLCVASWILTLSSGFAIFSMPLSAAEPDVRDVVVYGGTSAAVTAAVQCKRMGKSVLVISPDRHLGGLTSGGLGWTDTGNKAVIGGLSREFYHRVWKHYQRPEAWSWQSAESYGNKGQGTAAIDGTQRTMWIFEPSVAEKVFDEWVVEEKISVWRDEWLDRSPGGVELQEGRIVSLRTLSGRTVRARMFIDATYEGDLMAAAGVSYHVGRESNETYGERWNGVQANARHHGHYFAKPVDPYVVPGDPQSGLLPRISAQPPGENGQGDHRIQAYCFRMCLTNHPENRVPFAKPKQYDPNQYELAVRVFESGWREHFRKFDPIPNRKTDTNNHGPFSTDNIGKNYDYPEASYERRREIIREHEDYQKGLMYFLANDPRVPDDVRTAMNSWGLAKDEFTDNEHWPHQIYVREARRMLGQYVMTENDCLGLRDTPEPVGMGSYSIDSHNVQRYVTAAGRVQNEGDIGIRPPRPYQVSYRSLTPKGQECSNLLVPVALSSSHSAFGSIRMEPVFMILGQSAATAAVLALEGNGSVQDVDYAILEARLAKDGQVLRWSGPVRRSALSLDPAKLKGVVIDDEEAKCVGFELQSRSIGPFVGVGYRHDGHQAKGEQTATFAFRPDKTGEFEVRLAYTPNPNRASNARIAITHADGVASLTVDQRKKPSDGAMQSLGVFRFDKATLGSVVVSNQDTDGHVIVDAVQFLAQ